MKDKEMEQHKVQVGQRYYIYITRQKIYVEVVIKGYVPSYGKVRYLVEPVAGIGKTIVEKLFTKSTIPVINRKLATQGIKKVLKRK